MKIFLAQIFSKSNDDRLLTTCKRMQGLTSLQMIELMTSTVNAFVGDAVQSDDITMLALKYIG